MLSGPIAVMIKSGEHSGTKVNTPLPWHQMTVAWKNTSVPTSELVHIWKYMDPWYFRVGSVIWVVGLICFFVLLLFCNRCDISFFKRKLIRIQKRMELFMFLERLKSNPPKH